MEAWKKIRKNNLHIIRTAVCCVEYCRRQQYYYGMQQASILMDLLMTGIEEMLVFLPELNEDAPFASAESVTQMLMMMQEAQEERDYVLLADLIEGNLLAFFMEYQQRLCARLGFFFDEEMFKRNMFYLKKVAPWAEELFFGFSVTDIYESHERLPEKSIDEVLRVVERTIEKGYAVEYAADGNYTIAFHKGGRMNYLHSNNLIAKEGFLLAKEWLEEDAEYILCYGLGFGYPYEMLLSLDESIELTVIEGNLNLLLLAVVFSNVSAWAENPRFSLKIDNSNKGFFEEMKRGRYSAAYVNAPFLQTIRSEKFRIKMEDFFIREASYRTQKRKLFSNFQKNVKIPCKEVHALKEMFQNKDLYIIAAGPSLDGNIQLLSKVDRKQSLILATGTVFNKLLSSDIMPDYIIISDSDGGGIARQLTENRIWKIPLLFLSTASNRAVAECFWEKYIIYQFGFEKAETLAKEQGIGCLETGGSVSTLALEVGIQLGCSRMIFLGLDLAYTGGKSHACGTKTTDRINVKEEIEVEDIYGQKVATAKNWNSYRLWIENRVQKMRDQGDFREVIDATEGGAKIKGLRIAKLEDLVK